MVCGLMISVSRQQQDVAHVTDGVDVKAELRSFNLARAAGVGPIRAVEGLTHMTNGDAAAALHRIQDRGRGGVGGEGARDQSGVIESQAGSNQRSRRKIDYR